MMRCFFCNHGHRPFQIATFILSESVFSTAVTTSKILSHLSHNILFRNFFVIQQYQLRRYRYSEGEHMKAPSITSNVTHPNNPFSSTPPFDPNKVIDNRVNVKKRNHSFYYHHHRTAFSSESTGILTSSQISSLPSLVVIDESASTKQRRITSTSSFPLPSFSFLDAERIEGDKQYSSSLLPFSASHSSPLPPYPSPVVGIIDFSRQELLRLSPLKKARRNAGDRQLPAAAGADEEDEHKSSRKKFNEIEEEGSPLVKALAFSTDVRLLYNRIKERNRHLKHQRKRQGANIRIDGKDVTGEVNETIVSCEGVKNEIEDGINDELTLRDVIEHYMEEMSRLLSEYVAVRLENALENYLLVIKKQHPSLFQIGEGQQLSASCEIMNTLENFFRPPVSEKITIMSSPFFLVDADAKVTEEVKKKENSNVTNAERRLSSTPFLSSLSAVTGHLPHLTIDNDNYTCDNECSHYSHIIISPISKQLPPSTFLLPFMPYLLLELGYNQLPFFYESDGISLHPSDVDKNIHMENIIDDGVKSSTNEANVDKVAGDTKICLYLKAVAYAMDVAMETVVAKAPEAATVTSTGCNDDDIEEKEHVYKRSNSMACDSTTTASAASLSHLTFGLNGAAKLINHVSFFLSQFMELARVSEEGKCRLIFNNNNNGEKDGSENEKVPRDSTGANNKNGNNCNSNNVIEDISLFLSLTDAAIGSEMSFEKSRSLAFSGSVLFCWVNILTKYLVVHYQQLDMVQISLILLSLGSLPFACVPNLATIYLPRLFYRLRAEGAPTFFFPSSHSYLLAYDSTGKSKNDVCLNHAAAISSTTFSNVAPISASKLELTATVTGIWKILRMHPSLLDSYSADHSTTLPNSILNFLKNNNKWSFKPPSAQLPADDSVPLLIPHEDSSLLGLRYSSGLASVGAYLLELYIKRLGSDYCKSPQNLVLLLQLFFVLQIDCKVLLSAPVAEKTLVPALKGVLSRGLGEVGEEVGTKYVQLLAYFTVPFLSHKNSCSFAWGHNSEVVFLPKQCGILSVPLQDALLMAITALLTHTFLYDVSSTASHDISAPQHESTLCGDPIASSSCFSFTTISASFFPSWRPSFSLISVLAQAASGMFARAHSDGYLLLQSKLEYDDNSRISLLESKPKGKFTKGTPLSDGKWQRIVSALERRFYSIIMIIICVRWGTMLEDGVAGGGHKTQAKETKIIRKEDKTMKGGQGEVVRKIKKALHEHPLVAQLKEWTVVLIESLQLAQDLLPKNGKENGVWTFSSTHIKENDKAGQKGSSLRNEISHVASKPSFRDNNYNRNSSLDNIVIGTHVLEMISINLAWLFGSCTEILCGNYEERIKGACLGRTALPIPETSLCYPYASSPFVSVLEKGVLRRLLFPCEEDSEGIDSSYHNSTMNLAEKATKRCSKNQATTSNDSLVTASDVHAALLRLITLFAGGRDTALIDMREKNKKASFSSLSDSEGIREKNSCIFAPEISSISAISSSSVINNHISTSAYLASANLIGLDMFKACNTVMIALLGFRLGTFPTPMPTKKTLLWGLKSEATQGKIHHFVCSLVHQIGEVCLRWWEENGEVGERVQDILDKGVLREQTSSNRVCEGRRDEVSLHSEKEWEDVDNKQMRNYESLDMVRQRKTDMYSSVSLPTVLNIVSSIHATLSTLQYLSLYNPAGYDPTIRVLGDNHDVITSATNIGGAGVVSLSNTTKVNSSDNSVENDVFTGQSSTFTNNACLSTGASMARIIMKYAELFPIEALLSAGVMKMLSAEQMAEVIQRRFGLYVAMVEERTRGMDFEIRSLSKKTESGEDKSENADENNANATRESVRWGAANAEGVGITISSRYTVLYIAVRLLIAEEFLFTFTKKTMDRYSNMFGNWNVLCDSISRVAFNLKNKVNSYDSGKINNASSRSFFSPLSCFASVSSEFSAYRILCELFMELHSIKCRYKLAYQLKSLPIGRVLSLPFALDVDSICLQEKEEGNHDASIYPHLFEHIIINGDIPSHNEMHQVIKGDEITSKAENSQSSLSQSILWRVQLPLQRGSNMISSFASDDFLFLSSFFHVHRLTASDFNTRLINDHLFFCVVLDETYGLGIGGGRKVASHTYASSLYTKCHLVTSYGCSGWYDVKRREDITGKGNEAVERDEKGLPVLVEKNNVALYSTYDLIVTEVSVPTEGCNIEENNMHDVTKRGKNYNSENEKLNANEKKSKDYTSLDNDSNDNNNKNNENKSNELVLSLIPCYQVSRSLPFLSFQSESPTHNNSGAYFYRNPYHFSHLKDRLAFVPIPYCWECAIFNDDFTYIDKILLASQFMRDAAQCCSLLDNGCNRLLLWTASIIKCLGIRLREPHPGERIVAVSPADTEFFTYKGIDRIEKDGDNYLLSSIDSEEIFYRRTVPLFFKPLQVKAVKSPLYSEIAYGSLSNQTVKNQQQSSSFNYIDGSNDSEKDGCTSFSSNFYNAPLRFPLFFNDHYYLERLIRYAFAGIISIQPHRSITTQSQNLQRSFTVLTFSRLLHSLALLSAQNVYVITNDYLFNAAHHLYAERKIYIDNNNASNGGGSMNDRLDQGARSSGGACSFAIACSMHPSTCLFVKICLEHIKYERLTTQEMFGLFRAVTISCLTNGDEGGGSSTTQMSSLVELAKSVVTVGQSEDYEGFSCLSAFEESEQNTLKNYSKINNGSIVENCIPLRNKLTATVKSLDKTKGQRTEQRVSYNLELQCAALRALAAADCRGSTVFKQLLAVVLLRKRQLTFSQLGDLLVCEQQQHLPLVAVAATRTNNSSKYGDHQHLSIASALRLEVLRRLPWLSWAQVHSLLPVLAKEYIGDEDLWRAVIEKSSAKKQYNGRNEGEKQKNDSSEDSALNCALSEAAVTYLLRR